MERAAALVILDGRVLLIERRREAETYYLFPGGRIEPGETREQALVRELREELGLGVTPSRLVAEVTYNGNVQSYFVTTLVAELPHAFVGDEAADAVWLPVEGLSGRNVRPAAVARLIEASPGGWPAEVLRMADKGRHAA